MKTVKYYSQSDLERSIRAKMTAVQTAKLATLEPLGWKIQKAVTNERGETGVFIYREVGDIFALMPPTVDARLITQAKNAKAIHYNTRTWERL